MERNQTRTSADEIKLKFVQRIMLLAFGFIAACVLIAALPVFAFASGSDREVPIPLNPADRYVAEEMQASGPAIELNEVGRDFEGSESMGGMEILIPVAILLVLIYLLGYGVYDMFRLYLQYRRARDVEEVMFP
jgi:hypothetical protein